MMGTLYIVSTPIGNIEDLSIRAIKILLSVPVLACEDTRVTGQLKKLIEERFLNLAILNLDTSQMKTSDQRFISYRDENEREKSVEIVTMLLEGKDVAIVSDAGTPLISDPGYILINDCIRKGVPVVSIPGPTSIISALTVSGLPTQPFWYYGYMPEKEGKREKLLSSIKESANLYSIPPTICFLMSPHKLVRELASLQTIMGDIEIVLARELTKMHEEIFRGKISEATLKFKDPKGEFVMVFRPTA